ncbi:MAG: DUF362 domain-containing protein [Chloroflexi bacterium]|nr:DUF362 domain-containing protein [Chloroflexota bacterium]
MASRVYFADMRTRYGRNLMDKVGQLFEMAGFSEFISKGDMVAIKLHVGEPGNLAYLSPPLVRRVVDRIKAFGGKPFLTDANTLYTGRRSNAIDHTIAAIENGFSYATVGAPFIVADGLNGQESVTVPLEGEGLQLKEARIGAALAHADVLIAMSHFKGHEATGFGGALKNIGMGGGSRAGKQVQHSELKPVVDPVRCTTCGRCLKVCPVKAIAYTEAMKALIDPAVCYGCGECVVVCRDRAIAVNWREGRKGSLQERMTEYAFALVQTKAGKCGFINFVMNVTPDCDCADWNDLPIVPNLGILASRDPVAIDQASVDLVNRAPGLAATALAGFTETEDKFRVLHSDVDWSIQLAHGERIGLGSREYELVAIDK